MIIFYHPRICNTLFTSSAMSPARLVHLGLVLGGPCCRSAGSPISRGRPWRFATNLRAVRKAETENAQDVWERYNRHVFFLSHIRVRTQCARQLTSFDSPRLTLTSQPSHVLWTFVLQDRPPEGGRLAAL